MANKDNAKQWVQTGDFPTEVQFHQTYDWLRWNDETIPLEDVEGLQDELDLKAPLNLVRTELVELNGDDSFLMPAGYKLNALAFKNESATDMVIAINNNPGNIINDYEVELAANATVDFEIGKTFWVETELFITGVTGHVYIRIDIK